jgi:hypothetical protein
MRLVSFKKKMLHREGVEGGNGIVLHPQFFLLIRMAEVAYMLRLTRTHCFALQIETSDMFFCHVLHFNCFDMGILTTDKSSIKRPIKN